MTAFWVLLFAATVAVLTGLGVAGGLAWVVASWRGRRQ